MLRIPNTKFLQLQKMVEGLRLVGGPVAWLRLNSNGLFIDTYNNNTNASSSLHILPPWFGRFNLNLFPIITVDKFSISFRIQAFTVNLNRADRNLYHFLQLSIADLDTNPVLHFDLFNTNQRNVEVLVRRDSIPLGLAENPLLGIELEERRSINPDCISFVDMNGASFLDAIQYATENNLGYVQLEITDPWVRLTVPQCPPFYIFKNEPGCVFRIVPATRTFICIYEVGLFSPRYLRSVSPTCDNNHGVKIFFIRVSVAENLPFKLDLHFDRWTRFRLRLPGCRVLIQDADK